MSQRFNVQRLAHLLIVLFLSVYFLIIAKNILAPIAFAVFFAFMLQPLADKIEGFIKSRAWAIVLTFLLSLLPVFAVISMFTAQSVDVFKNMPAISGKVKTGINQLFSLLNHNFGFSKAEGQQWLEENFNNLLDAPLSIIGEGLSSSTALVINLLLMFLYTFFILLYRTSFKNFLLIQLDKKRRDEGREMINNIQNVAQKYLYGLMTVIAILGTLNSIGLWIIGIDYAFFWGFLGAFLAIIPYVGTFLGGLLPFVYAIATTTTLWQPFAIILLYGTVQTIEGNFITPKIIGSSVEVNPLAAIISLLIGGAIWGVAGLILALPIIAVIKIILEHIPVLKPVALLLSSDLYEKRNDFLEEFDKEEYRIANFFKRQKKP